MIPKERLEEAAEWAAETFLERTRRVLAGTCTIDEVMPEYRVSWGEVRSRFFPGDDWDFVALRLEYQPHAERALRRRGLLALARGNITDDQWAEREQRKRERGAQ